MEANRNRRNEFLAKKVMKGLESRNMKAYYAASKEEALKLALDLIPEGSSCGWGGSVSIDEIGLKDAVKNGNYTVFDRDGKPFEEQLQIYYKILSGSDWFLASANAITEDGILVNIDGNANRVAAIAFGPKHVLFIVGMNKVCRDVDSAVARARNEAATINNQRFVGTGDTPCRLTGSCADCKSPATICCQFLITRYSKFADRIHVILVNDDLGF